MLKENQINLTPSDAVQDGLYGRYAGGDLSAEGLALGCYLLALAPGFTEKPEDAHWTLGTSLPGAPRTVSHRVLGHMTGMSRDRIRRGGRDLASQGLVRRDRMLNTLTGSQRGWGTPSIYMLLTGPPASGVSTMRYEAARDAARVLFSPAVAGSYSRRVKTLVLLHALDHDGVLQLRAHELGLLRCGERQARLMARRAFGELNLCVRGRGEAMRVIAPATSDGANAADEMELDAVDLTDDPVLLDELLRGAAVVEGVPEWFLA